MSDKRLFVKATLKTRCGCIQSLDIPFPPQPYILIALKPKAVCVPQSNPDLSQPIMQTRKFELDTRSVIQAGGECFAIYEEGE